MTSTLAMPLLVFATGAVGGSNGSSCTGSAATSPSTEAAPPIMGTALLRRDQLTTWWTGLRRGEPAGLDVGVAEVIERYVNEGEAEGIRGDLAFAQAVHETGYFTSSDTARNNFAGIAHPNGTAAGTPFPDVETGVRAHVQLLKKYAAGNGTRLATPDVAPRAGARATTWSDLAGTWATDSSYWTSISAIYDDMRDAAGSPSASAAAHCETDGTTPRSAGDGQPDLVTVGGITVDASIANQLEQLLAAAEADGLLLNGSGYRSHDRQIELRRQHCGTSEFAIYEMPSSQCSPPTARPGSSMHEQGLAIDFVNCSSRSSACHQWLAANAAAYGFHNLPSEPWHWSVSGA